MRLIDAEKLIEEGYSLERTYRGDISSMVIERREIKDIPVVDAVPVVRCRDCMWYVIRQLKKDGTDDKRYKPSYCLLWDNYFKPDFFCADGERRAE